jgi:hypothetical protein
MTNTRQTDIEKAVYHLKELALLMPRILPQMDQLVQMAKVFSASPSQANGIGHSQDLFESLPIGPNIGGHRMDENRPPTEETGRLFWILWTKKEPMTPSQVVAEFEKRKWIREGDHRLKQRLWNKFLYLKNMSHKLDGSGKDGYTLSKDVLDKLKMGIPA